MQEVTRRIFGLTAFGASLLVAARTVQAIDGYAKGSLVPDHWVQEWLRDSKMHKELKGPLDLRRFKDPFYVLLAPIQWKPNAPSALSQVTVPQGFVTDFASIPRVFWSLFRPDGDCAYAAVLHDFLYWQQERPKSDADQIFKSAMSDLRITDRQASVLYKAVDKFGSRAWKSNSDLKARGEKRVLGKLPENPGVTWAQWKTQPDVFIL